ncbi:MAG: carboxypeptidase-like regulatory domain-containing protein, partial [Pyrinomonadaceae bacterium]
TVTEGNLFPGGLVSFGITSGSGTVTVDHVNAGTGLQSLTLVGAPVNAAVNIPVFTAGTYNPTTVTFAGIDPNQAVDFTLRATSTFHAANIRVRCTAQNPTPTPTPTATPTPTPTATPTPTPTPTPPPGNVCTPITTVTEGDLFPGGLVSFGITSGSGTVTVDHVNAGTGLRAMTVVGTPVNAIVSIPSYTPGTYNPATVTFTVINPNQSVDFTLRAASTYHAANIRARCTLGPTPTPTPNGTPTPTPTPVGTPTATPTPVPTPPPTLTFFAGKGTSVTGTLLGQSGILNDTGLMSSGSQYFRRVQSPAGTLFSGLLTGQDMDSTAQAAFDQSRSQAIIANVSFTVNGNLITAALIPTSSQCTCPAANTPPQCLGGLLLDRLFLNGTQIRNPPAPNEVTPIPGGGQIITDEEVRTASGNTGTLTVVGVHVIIPGVTDMMFGRSYASIFCGSNVSTIEGGGDVNVSQLSVSGRVLTPDGRGVRNAKVVITGPDGSARTVTTSDYGYYSFDEVESGKNYVIGVISKRYTFASRVIPVFDTVEDTLKDVDFLGN